MRYKNIDEITENSFKEAIIDCFKSGITSVAPLGFSGDTIILFGYENNGRKSLVSIRNYGNDAELLITDKEGHFLFYGRYHISMGIDFVSNQYWKIFSQCKMYIESIIPKRPDFADLQITDKAIPTDGFDMLNDYQRKAILTHSRL